MRDNAIVRGNYFDDRLRRKFSRADYTGVNCAMPNETSTEIQIWPIDKLVFCARNPMLSSRFAYADPPVAVRFNSSLPPGTSPRRLESMAYQLSSL